VLSSETNNDGSGVSQGHRRDHFGPATQRWALQMKKEEHAPKEPFNTPACAQFFFGPRGRDTGALLLVLGIPRDDRNRSKHAMNPSNEAQAPLGSIQTDDTGADLVKAYGPC
jgi:hypothetical protein